MSILSTIINSVCSRNYVDYTITSAQLQINSCEGMSCLVDKDTSVPTVSTIVDPVLLLISDVGYVFNSAGCEEFPWKRQRPKVGKFWSSYISRALNVISEISLDREFRFGSKMVGICRGAA